MLDERVSTVHIGRTPISQCPVPKKGMTRKVTCQQQGCTTGVWVHEENEEKARQDLKKAKPDTKINIKYVCYGCLILIARKDGNKVMEKRFDNNE